MVEMLYYSYANQALHVTTSTEYARSFGDVATRYVMWYEKLLPWIESEFNCRLISKDMGASGLEWTIHFDNPEDAIIFKLRCS